MEQNICVRQLLQCRLERGHQMMRQFADESDRVGEQNLLRVRDAQLARRRVERVKQPVVGLNPRTGQRIEQRGLSRVGISHNGNQRQLCLFALSALDGTHLPDGFQVSSQFVNAPSDVTAVALELGLTRAARADAAALTGQHLAHAGKPREDVLILCQLDLQFSLSGAGALGENIQNQCAPVEHRPSGHLLQNTHLRRRQLVVHHNQRRVILFGKLAQLLHLSLAEKRACIRRRTVLQHLCRTLAAGRLEQILQFIQRFPARIFFLCKCIGVQSHKNRAFACVFLFFPQFHRLLPLQKRKIHFSISYSSLLFQTSFAIDGENEKNRRA